MSARFVCQKGKSEKHQGVAQCEATRKNDHRVERGVIDIDRCASSNFSGLSFERIMSLLQLRAAARERAGSAAGRSTSPS